MKNQVLLYSMAMTLLLACQNSSDKNKSQNALNVEQQDTAQHNHEDHSGHPTTVKLNNGQRWSANAETSEGINKMTMLLEILPKDPKAEDYHSLKTNLEKEFDTILQKCTMKGEAHIQLHNYLLPMKEMINSFDSNSAEECKEASNNLKTYLKEYDKYFQ